VEVRFVRSHRKVAMAVRRMDGRPHISDSRLMVRVAIAIVTAVGGEMISGSRGRS
jgi:uncharacterized protein (DUF433 family)